jgi:hypothetical protein
MNTYIVNERINKLIFLEPNKDPVTAPIPDANGRIIKVRKTTV